MEDQSVPAAITEIHESPKLEGKVHGSLSGEDILRIMKLAKSAGIKQFSCNGLVFSFV